MDITTAKAKRCHRVLRISQLDSSELDSELYGIFRSQIYDVIRYFKPSVTLESLEPEINLILKLIIWKLMLYDKGRSVGQSLLNISYHNERHAQPNTDSESGSSTAFVDTSKSQRVGIAALLIGSRYLQERLELGLPLDSLNHSQWRSKALKLISQLEVVGEIVGVINFLLFLRFGVYQHVWERVLGVRAVTTVTPRLRQLGYNMMNRELLWHGFSELLLFVLPLINVRRVRGWLRSVYEATFGVEDAVGSEWRKDVAPGVSSPCAVCNQWPIHPHHMGCAHVYCYYCIQSNFDADAHFTCPLCRHQITSVDDIRPITSL